MDYDTDAKIKGDSKHEKKAVKYAAETDFNTRVAAISQPSDTSKIVSGNTIHI
jgi:hypothetical protein